MLLHTNLLIIPNTSRASRFLPRYARKSFLKQRLSKPREKLLQEVATNHLRHFILGTYSLHHSRGTTALLGDGLVLDHEQLRPLLGLVDEVVLVVFGNIEGVSCPGGELVIGNLVVGDDDGELPLQDQEDEGVDVSVGEPLAGVGGQPHVVGDVVGRGEGGADQEAVMLRSDTGPDIVRVRSETFNLHLPHLSLTLAIFAHF